MSLKPWWPSYEETEPELGLQFPISFTSYKEIYILSARKSGGIISAVYLGSFQFWKVQTNRSPQGGENMRPMNLISKVCNFQLSLWQLTAKAEISSPPKCCCSLTANAASRKTAAILRTAYNTVKNCLLPLQHTIFSLYCLVFLLISDFLFSCSWSDVSLMPMVMEA